MHFDLKYGAGTLPLDVSERNLTGIVLPGKSVPLPDPEAAVRKALHAPTGTPPLLEMLKAARPGNVVIVVNDITRPTPYDILMPPLIAILEEAGIPDSGVTLVTASGIHEAHDDRQNREVYGKDICRRFRIVSHDPFDRTRLVYKGVFDSGYEFWLNRAVNDCDFLITLGVVMPHYFAGFSGGRKSILPGVAGKDTVEKNHARMVEIMDNMPDIRENPISLEMIKAARIAGVDFILNVVVDDSGRLIEVVAGDLEAAWYKAVAVSEAMYMVPISGRADISIASSSGYPRDSNLYQAQKALDHADKATREGGTIILLAECAEGYGDPVFERYMKSGDTAQGIMDKIRKNFVMGGHKAYGFAKVSVAKKVIFVTDLSEKIVKSLFARKAASPREALAMALRDQGAEAEILVLPEGSVTVPVVRD